MNNDNYRGDDLISKPPAGTVLLRKIGSWDILFSRAEQNLYIVPTDYHPEPFRISLSDLNALQAALAPKPAPQLSPETSSSSTPTGCLYSGVVRSRRRLYGSVSHLYAELCIIVREAERQRGVI